MQSDVCRSESDFLSLSLSLSFRLLLLTEIFGKITKQREREKERHHFFSHLPIPTVYITCSQSLLRSNYLYSLDTNYSSSISIPSPPSPPFPLLSTPFLPPLIHTLLISSPFLHILLSLLFFFSPSLPPSLPSFPHSVSRSLIKHFTYSSSSTILSLALGAVRHWEVMCGSPLSLSFSLSFSLSLSLSLPLSLQTSYRPFLSSLCNR